MADPKWGEWITEDGLTAIEGFAREGLSDVEIAGKMGIAASTLYEWRKKFPEILDALKKGKAPVDAKVENALLKRALGYEYEETTTEISEQPDGSQRKIIRKVKKHVIPDTTAQIVWLCNRRADRWKRNPSFEMTNDDPLLILLKKWEDAANADSKPETT